MKGEGEMDHSYVFGWIFNLGWEGRFFFGSTAVFGGLLMLRDTDDPECQEEYEYANDKPAHLLEKYVKTSGRRMK